MKDILYLLYEGKISAEDAREMIDQEIEKVHQNLVSPEWWSTVGFSNHEVTAYAHGASPDDLVKFRYGGWPKFCGRCELPIDYKQFGWWFYKDGADPKIRHITCAVQIKDTESKTEH